MTVGALATALNRDDDAPVLWTSSAEPLRRQQVRLAAERLAARIGDRDGQLLWVATDDPYSTLLAVAAATGRGRPAVVPVSTPAGACPALAAGGRPQLVLQAGTTQVGAWALGEAIETLDMRDDGCAVGRSELRDGSVSFWSSGTSAQPRLVEIGAERIDASIGGVAAILELGQDDRSLCIAPLDHTLGLLTSVVAALAAGGGVLLATGLRPSVVAQLCDRAEPTWCAAAPATMRVLTARDGPSNRLRFLRTSGAPLPPTLASELSERFGGPTINAYAMTEAPGEIASQGLHGPRRAGSVGRPTLCSVDVRMIESVEGVAAGVGAVWVSGPNVVTAGRDGWLDTGDLGRMTEDGELVLCGRADDLINRGGQKVSPEQLEATAAGYPGVAECAAFPIPRGDSESLVGLAVVSSDLTDPVSESAVRRYLAHRLPREILPHRIQVVAALPHTARGKVSRRQLADRLGLVAEPADPSVTGTEE